MLQADKSHVRVITPEEISVIEGLSIQNGSVKPDSYWERCREAISTGSMTILLAELADKPVGYAILNWTPKYRFYEQFEIPEIQDLNVISNARKKGLATAIINRCEQMALADGREQIGISYGLTPDYGSAQRLYARLGYMPDGLGVTYDRQPVSHGQIRPVDDNLCLMLVKELG